MSNLRLSVLSGLTIEHDGKPVFGLTSLKAQALLVYVAVTGRPQLRQTLAGVLWTDVAESSARMSLRTALSQVRKAVGDHVLTDQHAILFDQERPHWIDVCVFEEACRRLQTEVPADKTARHSLREAVYLFRDGFLAGFPETDTTVFEEWVLQQRQQYLRLAIDALQRLAAHALEHKALDTGIEDARRILQLDPLHEEAHRLLMQFYARSGNIVAALRQYDECVRVLDIELGVRPSKAIAVLAQVLRDGRWISGVSEPETTAPVGMDTPIANNLPAALTPLVGRHAELAKLEKLLGSNDVRLVSIVGPGGMGKTRLSLAVAQQQVDIRGFTHGVYFVEFALLGEPEHILNVVAEAIRLPLSANASDSRLPKERLLNYLRAKEMLLVLDNFEHVLKGAELVVEILQAAPGVKILITSRERLLLPSEQVFPILGLDYGSTDRLRAASIPAAGQLFVQSAQRVAPSFVVSNEELVQVIQVCQLVEGMPLAIELAASWIEILTPDEIVHELLRSLDILETEQRGMPARHRSIRAVFGGTWQSLEEPIKAIFAALSVFRGGFTRIAAQQVSGASLPQLSILAGRSLIQFDRENHRYTLHEMLRQYGAERLAEDPEADADARRRHSIYFCGIAQTRGEELLGTHQMKAIVDLEREVENLRVAWQWAISQRFWNLVNRAIDGLGFFYEWQGRLEDGEVAFRIASGALQADSGADVQVLLGRALTWRSVFAHAQGRTSEAETYLAEALCILEQEPADNEGLLKAQAFVWLQVGIQSFTRDDDKARDGFARSLSLHQRIKHIWGTARALSGLGQADADAGNYAGAQIYFREAIDLLWEIGDRRSEAHSLHRLAILLRNAGSIEESVPLARQSYRLYREMGERAGIAWSGQILAECLNFAGVSGEAVKLLHTAEMVATDLGDSSRLANIYQEQAMILGRMGHYQEGHDKGEMGLALARRLDQPVRVAWCQNILATLDLYAGEAEAAELRLRESEKLLETAVRIHELAIVYALQAEVSLALGESSRARQRTLESLRLSLRHRDYRVFLGLRALAMLLTNAGRNEDALAVFGQLERSGLSNSETRSPFRPWLTSVTDIMSPESVAEAMARYREAEVWEFVVLWVAELEKMVQA